MVISGLLCINKVRQKDSRTHIFIIILIISAHCGRVKPETCTAGKITERHGLNDRNIRSQYIVVLLHLYTKMQWKIGENRFL